MPTKKSALILKYEGITKETALDDTRKRLTVLRSVLDRAVREGQRVWGRKLRQTAAVMLYINVHDEVRRMIRPDALEAEQLSKKQRWMTAAKKARKVLDAQIKHVATIKRLHDLEERVRAGDDTVFPDIPQEYPQKAYYVRYLRPLFGEAPHTLWRWLSVKRDIWERQQAIEEIGTGIAIPESPVPALPEDVKSNEKKPQA